MRDPFGALVDRPPISPQAGPVVAAPGAAAAAAAGGDAAAGSQEVPQRQQRQRRRAPLPHDTVSELRAMLARNRYPEPEAREALAKHHCLDRKRVDRWLENARARSRDKGSAVKDEVV